MTLSIAVQILSLVIQIALFVHIRRQYKRIVKQANLISSMEADFLRIDKNI